MTAVAVQTDKPKGVNGAPAESAGLMVMDSATELLRIAVEKGVSVEHLEKLVALHERMEERQAAKEFSAAMAAFQAECPAIKKSSTAQIVTGGGAKFGYTYAELDEIARTINPIMAKHGLSYSWDSTVDGGKLTCVCTVRHAAGHSQNSTFTLPIDTKAGMSEQQKVAAALTFAQRKSLASVMGLTTTDEDTDGGAEVDPTKISADQMTVISDLIKETSTDLARFLRYMGVASIAEIRASDYQRAINALEQKRAKK